MIARIDFLTKLHKRLSNECVNAKEKEEQHELAELASGVQELIHEEEFFLKTEEALKKQGQISMEINDLAKKFKVSKSMLN